MSALEIALAGNPNTGKTCIFNGLTGARQSVGNWPGVTVEKKEGETTYGGKPVKIVDLPGAYSLGPFSEDEVVARQYLVTNRPSAVINVVDACNLQRNLYLTLQLMEAGANVVVALNMMDEAQRSSINIDIEKLSALLGVPVVPTVASKGLGISQVLKAASESSKAAPLVIDYGPDLEKHLSAIEKAIASFPQLGLFPPRWLAVKLLEDDVSVKEDLQDLAGGGEVIEVAGLAREKLGRDLDVDSALIARRHRLIGEIISHCLKEQGTEGPTLSDKIDSVLTHKILGIPIFFAIMYLVFEFTFRLSGPFVDLIEQGLCSLGVWLGSLLFRLNASALFTSFIVDGLIGGLGTVLAIIPILLTLFLGIAILEDSGYMARVAYVMDKPMRAMGLNGKAFIPFLLGFGCNVPAIVSTRTLDSRRDRLLAIVANPFISCTARLPIYIAFAGAFFPSKQMLVVVSLYALGLVIAVLTVKLFSLLIPADKEETFIIELPPYRLPSLRGVFIGLWEKIADFLRKVSTIILAAVVIIWALSSLPLGAEYAGSGSVIGRISSFIAPIFRWAGFGSWQATVALIFGVLAKEVVVSTLGVVYKAGGAGLGAALLGHFTPLSAYAFLVMTLLYTPCIATIATIKNETKSWKWTAIVLAYGFAVAWILAVLTYQLGLLFGLQ